MRIAFLLFLKCTLAFHTSTTTRFTTHYRQSNSFPTKTALTTNNDENIKLVTSTRNTARKEVDLEDIIWRMKPGEGTSRIKRLFLKIAANFIRLDCFLKRQEPPKVLCPKGATSTLEAYANTGGIFRKKIAKFGITTQRGPACKEIIESIQNVYQINPNINDIGVAAIKYMFVEPKYRSLGIGELALQIISAIHAYQACDFTVLVADDNGSGKLIKWYERYGSFYLAPKLQDMFGSPDGVYGLTMIAPTNLTTSDFFERNPVIWW